MKKIKLWSFTMVVAVLSVACVNDDFNNSGTLEGNQTNGENIKLGMKKKIAFTIENMQKAYENIKYNSTAKQFPGNGQHYRTNNETNNYSGTDYIINTTHYYYKFTPRDSIQYERLVNDSILSVTDIPFEYVIETDGEKYQAADMSNTNFTHYYSVVPIDYNIPSEIEYEVIANLHFTKEDEIEDNASEYDLQKVDFFHDLNTEALKISDNLEEEKENLLYQFVNPNGETETLTWQQAQNRGLNLEQLVINFNEDDYDAPDFFARRSKWNPCGTVTTQEDAVNINVGVWDAKIKVRKWGWLVIREAYTNQNGQFQTSSTRTKRVKYAVWFKNNNRKFVVKAGTVFWDAKHRGHRTHKRECWNQHFTKGSYSHFYSLIHNAARDYFTRAMFNFGMHSPRGSSFFSEKLKICGKWNSSNSNMFDLPLPVTGSLVSEIRIGRKDNSGNHKSSIDIFGTVTHEMAHASHYRMDPLFFINIPSCERKLIRESWATCVETVVTNNRYNLLTSNPIYNFNNLNLSFYNRNYQRHTIDGTGGFDKIDEYSPLFIDLIDTINQNLLALPGNQPIDRTSGYTIQQLQQSLNTSRGLHGLKERIKNMHTNTTSGFVDELFNQYAFNYCNE